MDEQEIDLLKLNYQSCMDGYNSRDSLANEAFNNLIHAFIFFLAVIASINIFAKIQPGIHIICCSMIGFAGLTTMVALLIGLESASSSKIALRKNCIEIENKFSDIFHNKVNSSDKPLNHWDIIEKRNKYTEETIFKGVSGSQIDGREGKAIFILASRIIILIWIMIVFFSILYGKDMAAQGPAVQEAIRIWPKNENDIWWHTLM